MRLLIDAGNSRIKWGVHDGSDWVARGAVPNAEIAGLAAQWDRWPIASVHGSLVAGADVGRALERCVAKPVQWVHAGRAAPGVRNHYRDPAQMGPDRWLAVLAARRLCPDDAVVVCAGTALTVESLTRDGDYLGGLILPGFRLMLRALAQETARLDQPVGERADFPQCTEDALATGALEALVGAIERARTRLADHTGRELPRVVVTGGDAAMIAPWLASPVQIVDNLVLMGLLEVADKS